MSTMSIDTFGVPGSPGALLQLMELRAFYEYGAAVALRPLWGFAPAGDGHPVMVLPGLGAGDESTRLLRSFLSSRGYVTYGWAQGSNLGLRSRVMGDVHRRLQDLAQKHARKVSLVGWSLGGVYARVIAGRAPDLSRFVVTLGCPITGYIRDTNASRLYEWSDGNWSDDRGVRRVQWHPTPPVPTTSIWSRTDGVVPWQHSVELVRDRVENIEVEASHFGLGMNPLVLYAIADRLAQPQDAWQPFQREGFRRAFYGDARG